MTFFVVLAQPGGGTPLSDGRCPGMTYACRARGVRLDRYDFGSATIILGADETEVRHRMFAASSTYVAAGMVRLDNRGDLERQVDARGEALSDLALVLRVVTTQGPRRITRVLGDFSVVIVDLSSRQVFAARDAFGVRRLFYAEHGGIAAFASRAELLASGDHYDADTLVEMAAGCSPSPHRTVYAGVGAIPPGCIAVLNGACPRIRIERYWSAEDFAASPTCNQRGHEAVDAFRALFTEAVRVRISDGSGIWAHLSGGLDSSSVVSMAQTLADRGTTREGIAGTVSFVYRWSTDSDERRYSDAVAQHFKLRNEWLAHDWFWRDDGVQPPLTDAPNPEYPLYARERSVRQLVRQAGGTVLLTGFGSDQYLLGNMMFFADWVSAGRAVEACREMLRRSARGRVAFWELAYRNAVLPLLPLVLQRRILRSSPPGWIDPRMAATLDIATRVSELPSYDGPRGRKYSGPILDAMSGVSAALLKHEILEEELEVRHPFLHRPLVEFGLQLSPELCVQPQARKWILREAMKGVLPDRVRARVGKGSNPGCFLHSLAHESQRIDAMLSDPILAQLGCIDPVKLRQGVEALRRARIDHLRGPVLGTLSTETWLQVRSGRWSPERNRQDQRTSSSSRPVTYSGGPYEAHLQGSGAHSER